MENVFRASSALFRPYQNTSPRNRLLPLRVTDVTTPIPPNSALLLMMLAVNSSTDSIDGWLTGFAGPRLAEAIEAVTSADAVIAVSPIFSASYSGLFKSFFDVLEQDALAGKPVLVGATGGTARHSLALEFALRPLFAYLRANVAPTAVFAASEDFGTAASGNTLAGRADRAGRELADLVLQHPRRDSRAQADPFTNPTPFEQLLGS